MRWGRSKPPPANEKYVNCYTFDRIVRSYHIWYAGIQNKELPLILMYIFLIKPQMASEMAHFHKKLEYCSNILLQSFQIDARGLNLRTSLKTKFFGTICVP